jgi:hypothetical protein
VEVGRKKLLLKRLASCCQDLAILRLEILGTISSLIMGMEHLLASRERIKIMSQPVLDLFPYDHHFRELHAALRTRDQMIHALVAGMYSEYSKESPEEILTALVSLKSLFSDCYEMSEEMTQILSEKLAELREQTRSSFTER